MMQAASTRPKYTASSRCAALMTWRRRWRSPATTSCRLRRPGYATAWEARLSARAASCWTCGASTGSCSTRAHERSPCSRGRPGTIFRTCCIRASRFAPCNRPISSASAARFRSTPTAWMAGAVAKSIKSMRVMLADGLLRTVSPTENRELFDLVVGGYGLFGVIVEAELDIADNLVYQTGRHVLDYRVFPALFAGEIEKDTNIGLMYGHLSTAPSTFLQEMLLYTYTKVDGEDFSRAPLGEVSGTKLRRLTINLSKQGPLFQELKWLSEKHIER